MEVHGPLTTDQVADLIVNLHLHSHGTTNAGDIANIVKKVTQIDAASGMLATAAFDHIFREAMSWEYRTAELKTALEAAFRAFADGSDISALEYYSSGKVEWTVSTAFTVLQESLPTIADEPGYCDV